MSNIPKLRFHEFTKNWEEQQLGEVSVIIGGGTPETIKKEYWNGNIQWFTPTEIKSDYVSKSRRTITDIGLQKSSARILPIGTILLTTRATIGEVSIALEECTTNQGFQSLVVNNNCNNHFIFNWIKKNKYVFISKANGSTFPEISKKEIIKIKIKLPEKEEQDEIASFLIPIDTKIEQLTKKESLLQEYKKGVMQKIFNQEIRFKADEGSEFCDWKKKQLNELMYEHKERNYEKDYTKQDVLSVSGSHGIVNQIELQGRSFAGTSVDNYHIVKVDDIVYTKSPLKANPYGIIKTNKYKDGIVSTLYAVYSPKECLFPEYINYYFEIHDNVNKYLRPLVHKGAKNDMKINNQHVLSGSISIPEKAEQVKIVSFLSSIDKKIEFTNIELEKTKEFKKALLQQMFV